MRECLVYVFMESLNNNNFTKLNGETDKKKHHAENHCDM